MNMEKRIVFFKRLGWKFYKWPLGINVSKMLAEIDIFKLLLFTFAHSYKTEDAG